MRGPPGEKASVGIIVNGEVFRHMDEPGLVTIGVNIVCLDKAPNGV